MTAFKQEENFFIEASSEITKSNFKEKILSIIGDWKIDNKNNYDYLIMNEAFNWKRLAIRIIRYLKVEKELQNLIIEWLMIPHLYATLSEERFKKLIGFEKYNAYLSYFYGITIERCLISYVEEELLKKQISYGNFVRYQPEEVYSKIYNLEYDDLMNEFLIKFRFDRLKLSEVEYENFTYWCFKKRIENSDPSKLASDTKKGTTFLYKFLESENRRINDKKNNYSKRKKNIDFVF
ncbi:MAG: hypothetical protein CL773_04180 [Chloroflexi bacterium]|mgnify:CR=1 FL=1|nr:hypothetical protein [Chloroflexota bacterium]|tara:strand:- start:7327 stop:8034 length:708 start_codon:yes stop_codon:yes gene_type:complete